MRLADTAIEPTTKAWHRLNEKYFDSTLTLPTIIYSKIRHNIIGSYCFEKNTIELDELLLDYQDGTLIPSQVAVEILLHEMVHQFIDNRHRRHFKKRLGHNKHVGKHVKYLKKYIKNQHGRKFCKKVNFICNLRGWKPQRYHIFPKIFFWLKDYNTRLHCEGFPNNQLIETDPFKRRYQIYLENNTAREIAFRAFRNRQLAEIDLKAVLTLEYLNAMKTAFSSLIRYSHMWYCPRRIRHHVNCLFLGYHKLLPLFQEEEC